MIDATPETAPFVSDLSAAEFLLVQDGGWAPIDYVWGDCSHGWSDQAASWRQSKTLHWISDALTEGQARALERMRQQAVSLGADGIVGVRLDTTDLPLRGDPKDHPTQHFHAAGTAVRTQRGPHDGSPALFTSHLSGQDTWALSAAGCEPLGIVFGFGVYHAKTALARPDRCAEVPTLTAGVYEARTHAMQAMQTQAAQLQASGVVGVTVELETSADWTVMFVVTGTAIRTPVGGIRASPPCLVLGLND